MSNLTRTIKSLPLIAVLFTCVVILSSAAIFASEDGTPSSEVTSWLAPDLDSVQVKQLAEEVYPNLSEATRAVHDVNDIYLLLYDDIRPALMGLGQNSNFSLPRIAFYEREIYNAIYGQPQSVTILDQILDNMLYAIDSRYYTIPELQAMTWNQLVDLNSTQGTALNRLTSISNQLTVLNSKFDFTWSDLPVSYLNTRTSEWGSDLSAYTWSNEFFVQFKSSWSAQNSTPSVIRLFIPLNLWNYNTNSNIYDVIHLDQIKTYDSSNSYSVGFDDYFFEQTNNGFYVYLFGFNFFADYVYNFHFTFDYTAEFMNIPGNAKYISFDTDSYQQLKQAFYQQKAANAQGSMASDVKRLADYLADPDKIAAEQASQGVIDDTLDGFTGSGSAAAKGSDIGSMKNISGSVQSGLDTGGSAGDAASVFSNANFWSWFTQSTSDGINNPYPAPTVDQRRGSGDEIPDFISGDHEELENYRNRRDRW